MAKLESEIFNLLQTSPGHQTADDVLRLCKENGISASVASVYRVLSKLANKGAIRRIPVAGGLDIYDKTLGHHGHLICKKCGKVSDFSLGNLPEIIQMETHVQPTEMDVKAWHICEACSAE